LKSELSDSVFYRNADIVTYNRLVENYENNKHDLQECIDTNNQSSLTIKNLEKQLEEANLRWLFCYDKICFFYVSSLFSILIRISCEKKKSDKEIENLRSQLNDSRVNRNADITTYNNMVENTEKNKHDLQQYISTNYQSSLKIENLNKQLEEANLR